MDDDIVLRQRLQTDDKNLKALLRASNEEFPMFLDYIKYSLANLHYKNIFLKNNHDHLIRLLNKVGLETASTTEINLDLINMEKEFLLLEKKKIECDQIADQISQLETRSKLLE